MFAVSKSAAAVRAPVRSTRSASRAARSVRVSAKDESKFFDLNDLENTAGSWDMYGQDDASRYPGLQAEFFERAAAPVARREAILGLLAVAGPAGIVSWGVKGAKDVKLPITVGPQKEPQLGPRDKL